MKALLYEQFRAAPSIVDLPDPSPTRDGVVVQVGASGVCRSDWHGWMGHDTDIHLPHVPGHELAGTVVAIGAGVERFHVGDRVTVPFSMGCGTCEQCSAGDHQICDNYFQPGFTGWGSFAQLVALPFADTNLVHLPDWLAFDHAASLGCRFVTSFRAVVAQGRTKAGEWLAVHGCGGVGLSAILIANALDARVIAVDINDSALNLARECGVAEVVNATKTNVVDAIREITQGGAHVSIDALGSAVTCRNSIECLRKRGRHVQVGLMTGTDAEVTLPMPIVIARELELVGSHGISATEYVNILSLIESGRVKLESLVTRRISLAEAVEVLPGMASSAQAGVTVIDRFA